jgi:hypothetical protein
VQRGAFLLNIQMMYATDARLPKRESFLRGILWLTFSPTLLTFTPLSPVVTAIAARGGESPCEFGVTVSESACAVSFKVVCLFASRPSMLL